MQQLLFFVRNSASAYRRSENVVIHPIVVAELELRDVERQIFRADFVECADDPALHQRPEAFNRIGMDRADNMLASAVVNYAVIVFAAEPTIARIGVGADNANAGRYGFANKGFDGFGFCVFDDASDDVSLALDRTDDGSFAASAATRPAIPLANVTVLIVAADVGFIDFDNAAEFGFGFDQSGADFVTHGERGFIRTEAHHALNLKGANSLFACEHQMGDAEPIAQRLIRVFKDGPGDMGEAIAGIGSAFVALPLEGHRRDGKDLRISTARATDTLRPAPSDEVFPAILFGAEPGLELADGHLVNWLRFTGHSDAPYRQEAVWH